MKKFLLAWVSLLVASLSSFADTSVPFEGEGTQDSPYLIQSKADLLELSKLSVLSDPTSLYTGEFNNFEGKFIKLTNDIDLEYDTEFKGLFVGLPPRITSTLSSRLQFKGTFDGDGHTIHRMLLDGVAWSVEPTEIEGSGSVNTAYCQLMTGFFGRVGGSGVVKNLNIGSDCKIQGYQMVGAIVGNLAESAVIENCRNYADVTAYGQYVGGIAGKIAYNAYATLCYNEGRIRGGHSYVGGIAGHSTGLLSKCANAGDISVERLSINISGTYNQCGGIAGSANNPGVSSDNLNAGLVTAIDACGGIAGEIQVMKRCINYGLVSSFTDNSASAIAAIFSGSAFGDKPADCYYDSQIITVGALGGQPFTGINPTETASLTSGTPITGFDTDLWQFDAGMYPVLKAFANEPKLYNARRAVAFISPGETALTITSDFTLADFKDLTWSINGNFFSISGNTVKVPAAKMTKPETLTATYGTYVKEIPIIFVGEGQTVTGPFPGEGTEESPYLLSTKADLIKLASLTGSNNIQEAFSKETFAGTYFKITNDIDLEYDPAFQGISVAAPFTLTTVIHFDGVIDGDGHTIHRMNINGVRWTVSPEESGDELPTADNTACHNETDYSSFVGRLGNGGVIRNLNIAADCRIVGFTPVGGLVADMRAGSLVENCRNYADVTGYNSQVGGIAGTVSDGATIRDCYNSGNIITGAIYDGGIAGNLQGKIERCVNTGDVSGRQICTNVPTGKGFFNAIGGIAGNATTSGAAITNCLNTGTVSGEQEAGGLLGTFGMASYCLNFGVVKVDAANSALAGNCFGNKANMTGKFPLYLYYDSQLNPNRAISAEDFVFNPGDGSDKIPATIGSWTAVLISGDRLDGLDSEIWQFDQDAYPVLRQFADEPKLDLARHTIAILEIPDNASTVCNEIALHNYDGKIKWSSTAGFTITDSRALPFSLGAATLTATAVDGTLTKTIFCTVQNLATLEQIATDKDVKDTAWYTLAGVHIAKPDCKDGQIYIVVITYTDGTTKSLKVLNK